MSNQDEKDPYDGVGGAYVVDKKTGKRVQSQAPTGPAKQDQAPAEKPAPATKE